MDTSEMSKQMNNIEQKERGNDLIQLRILMPGDQQVNINFLSTDTVWVAKQKIFGNSVKELQDSQNYGLFCPPSNGRAGKFMEDERLLSEYSLSGNVQQLHLKYKQRIDHGGTNSVKRKKLNSTSNQKEFMEYVRKNDVEKVNKLLNKGFDPNFNTTPDGETPLTLSACLLRPRLMMIGLVSGGAFVDFRNKKGKTSLHVAAIQENKDAMKTLLDLGCSPNYKDKEGLTPLFYCSKFNKDSQCVTILLYERALMECKDVNGWTELHHACKEGSVQIVEQLLFYGADMNGLTNDKNTPLHICAKFNQQSCCKVLLLRGADKTILNGSNMMPSDVASINDHGSIARLINDFQADDVVFFSELPTYNNKRRGILSETTVKNIARSRSIPNIQNLFDDLFDSRTSVKSLSTPTPNGVLPKSSSANYRASAMESLLTDSIRHKQPNSSTPVSNDFEEHIFVLNKTGSMGYGFTLMCPNVDFESSKQPAMQYFDKIEIGKLAYDAGIKSEDYLIEINGTNVSKESHATCVELIHKSGNFLRLKVLRRIKSNYANEIKNKRDSDVANNQDLLATLENFDKILKQSPMLPKENKLQTSNSELSFSSTTDSINAAPDILIQSDSSVPPPPPLPPIGTLGKSSYRSQKESLQVDGENGSGSNSLSISSGSKTGTVRSSAGILPEAAHDALMEAIKRRRVIVDNPDDLSGNIESRVNKSRKLQNVFNSEGKSSGSAVKKLQNDEMSKNKLPPLLLAPVSHETKTLPKSFKKSPSDAPKVVFSENSDLFNTETTSVVKDEISSGYGNSKTLPKKSSDLILPRATSSEVSDDFLAVAEMMRTNFLKKKQQNAEENTAPAVTNHLNNETFSLNNPPEQIDEATKKNPMAKESPSVRPKVDDEIKKPENSTTAIQLSEKRIDNDQQSNGHSEIRLAVLNEIKKRKAPAPPSPRPQENYEAKLSLLGSSDTTQNVKLNSSPKSVVSSSDSNALDNSTGSGSIPQSPISFGNFANIVAEKAAKKQKESELKGMIPEPPSAGTTKRYLASSDSKSFAKQTSYTEKRDEDKINPPSDKKPLYSSLQPSVVIKPLTSPTSSSIKKPLASPPLSVVKKSLASPPLSVAKKPLASLPKENTEKMSLKSTKPTSVIVTNSTLPVKTSTLQSSPQSKSKQISLFSVPQDNNIHTKLKSQTSLNKTVYGANKTVYTNNNHKPFVADKNSKDELRVENILPLPPPAEFSTTVNPKVNGTVSNVKLQNTTSNRASGTPNKSLVMKSSYSMPSVAGDSNDDKVLNNNNEPSSPETIFPTLKKTNQPQSNTTVFKAKVGTSPQYKRN